MSGFDVTFTVAKLNEYINTILNNDVRLRSVRVSGEISSLKFHSASGHLYFTLKDESSSIRCVMFKSKCSLLRFIPRDGLKVIVRGKPEIYAPTGQFSLNVTSMQESGEGELYLRFLETKDKLSAEGLFEQKRKLPFLPRCVGIVTSDSGAAYRDICNVIRRRFPNMNILLSPAIVQGKDAPESLVNALNLLINDGRSDVIIIGRGGGSYDELSCFNDETLARAIFASPIPTISAVGHEVDFTIADFVADYRASTPSVAAEICVPVETDLLNTLQKKAEMLELLMLRNLNEEKSKIRNLSNEIELNNPKVILEKQRQRLLDVSSKLEQSIADIMNRYTSELNARSISLDALNPNAILKRGYAFVENPKGSFVNSIAAVNSGDSLIITLADGQIYASVEKTVNTHN